MQISKNPVEVELSLKIFDSGSGDNILWNHHILLIIAGTWMNLSLGFFPKIRPVKPLKC